MLPRLLLSAMHANPSDSLIDPVAARRWLAHRPAGTPWLHEEVARRMAERLGWIRLPVQQWALWLPEHSGRLAHELVMEHHRHSSCIEVFDGQEGLQTDAPEAGASGGRWWQRLGRARGPGQTPAAVAGVPPEASVQLVWANMLAHHDSNPHALIGRWHQALAVDGFLMFSCLGPDSLRELRALYQALGWPPPAHEFTDMHDWGDLLLAAGFSDPVMDMEHITLTFETPARLLAELRELGRNLSLRRHAACRSRDWRRQLEHALDTHLRPEPGAPLTLTFELIYGHAVKPEPRHAVAAQTTIRLDDMRASLRRREKP